MAQAHRSGPSAADIALAVAAASTPWPRGVPLTCSQCNEALSSFYYSGAQLKKKAKRRCNECVHPGSGAPRPQKRAAPACGNVQVLALPPELVRRILDMIYDYDPASGKSTLQNCEPQLIGSHAAGLYVAALFARASHLAYQRVRDWASGVIRARNEFIADDNGMAMARAVLKQSESCKRVSARVDGRWARGAVRVDVEPAGLMLFGHSGGLDGVREYDELIRDSVGAVQMRPHSQDYLAAYAGLLTLEGHPESCYTSSEKGFKHASATTLGAGGFVHVDRSRRTEPKSLGIITCASSSPSQARCATKYVLRRTTHTYPQLQRPVYLVSCAHLAGGMAIFGRLHARWDCVPRIHGRLWSSRLVSRAKLWRGMGRVWPPWRLPPFTICRVAGQRGDSIASNDALLPGDLR